MWLEQGEEEDKREWVGLEAAVDGVGLRERFGLGFHFHSPSQVT